MLTQRSFSGGEKTGRVRLDIAETVATVQGSRRIVFEALSAGVSYVMQLIGLGGSTGQSDWSESVTKMVN